MLRLRFRLVKQDVASMQGGVVRQLIAEPFSKSTIDFNKFPGLGGDQRDRVKGLFEHCLVFFPAVV